MSHAVVEPGEQEPAEDDHRTGVSAKMLVVAACAALAIGGLG